MTGEMNWGEAYFDHYQRCFGNVAARAVFAPHSPGPAIQVLAYDNVIQGCRVYASLGLTHYSEEVGSIGEAIVCTNPDDEWPYILASSLFYLVNSRMQLGWGMIVGGVEIVAPDFVDWYKKPALYFSLPTLFPDYVRRVRQGAAVGKLYLITPITQPERDYFTKHGATEFERLLESSRVDTLELDRPSAI